MAAYYSEHDAFVAQWLRNLIAAGHIAPGEVDERSIEDVEPADLAGFTQCHFFAGIGVWSHALRNAGWPDDRMVWTGSCPCQPFSAAGQRKGHSDERHLWPAFFHLIDECRPPVVVGEQVASKDGLQWLDLVSADLEGAGYAFGASDLCAAGFGGVHIRQRLYFVGVADSQRFGRIGRQDNRDEGRRQFASGFESETGGMANTVWTGWPERRSGTRNGPVAGNSAVSRVEYADGIRQYRGPSGGQQPLCNKRNRTDQEFTVLYPGQIASRWLDVDWLLCRNPDGEPSWRPVEPGTFPLAHGIASRMGKLRAYGNALDAETATGFIGAVIDALGSS